MPITEIAQGNHNHQWQLTDLHNSDKAVGSVMVTADYKWLRDTKDEGSYEHASQVVINKRRMRQFLVSHCSTASLQHSIKVQGWCPCELPNCGKARFMTSTSIACTCSW